MLRFSRSIGKVFVNTTYRSITSCSILEKKRNVVFEIQSRAIGTKDVFSSESLKISTIPELPLQPPPNPSITDMISQGQSLLNEMDLFCWYQPAGYLRWAMESLHMNLDMPWWATIVITTAALRLALIYVPILGQRNAALQTKYAKELDEFKCGIEEARLESDNRRAQLILLKQQQFMKERGIKIGRQALVITANSGIFLTQFFAIKKFTSVEFPGFDTGGILWFDNLLVPDPYYILPVSLGILLHLSLKNGMEIGKNINDMSKITRILLLGGLPVVAVVSSCFFPSAISVYWITSSTISYIFSVIFNIESVRKYLKITKADPSLYKKKRISFKDTFNKLRKTNKSEPTLEQIRKKDYENFKKAGKDPVSKNN